MGTKHILVNNVPFDTNHMAIHLGEHENKDGSTSYEYSVEDRGYPNKRVYSLVYLNRQARDQELADFIQAFQAYQPVEGGSSVLCKFYI